MAVPSVGGGIGGPRFTPRSVSLGPGQNSRIPYINNIDWLRNRHTRGTQMQPGAIDHPAGGGAVNSDAGPAKLQIPADSQDPPPNVLGSEAVRATGTGPYAAVYRQNLATYAGGQFTRPGGNWALDPSGGLFGKPTGGGNAPVLGTPDSLVGQALSRNPFKFTQPPPPAPSDKGQLNNPLGRWRDQFLDHGQFFGGGLRMMNLQ